MPLEMTDWEAFEYSLKGGYKHRLGTERDHMTLYWEVAAQHQRASGEWETKPSFTLDIETDYTTTRYRFDTLEEAVAMWNVHEKRIAVAIAQRAMRLH